MNEQMLAHINAQLDALTGEKLTLPLDEVNFKIKKIASTQNTVAAFRLSDGTKVACYAKSSPKNGSKPNPDFDKVIALVRAAHAAKEASIVWDGESYEINGSIMIGENPNIGNSYLDSLFD